MRYTTIRDRLIALFLFGAVVISPPLLAIFRAEAFVFGIPLLFFYLFAGWAFIVGLLAIIVEGSRRNDPDTPPRG